jgi:hypothetical protein
MCHYWAQSQNTTAKPLTKFCHDVHIQLLSCIWYLWMKAKNGLGRTNVGENANLDFCCKRGLVTNLYYINQRTFEFWDIPHLPIQILKEIKSLDKICQQNGKEKKDQYINSTVTILEGLTRRREILHPWNFILLEYITGRISSKCKRFFNPISNLWADKMKEKYKDV